MQNPHAGGTGCPCTHSGGAHRWGPHGKEGEGACPLPFFTPPVRVSHRTQSGRVPTEDAGERKGGGKRVLAHCLCVIFLCLYLFKPCFITTYLVAQNNTKSGVQIIWRKNRPDRENGVICQKLTVTSLRICLHSVLSLVLHRQLGEFVFSSFKTQKMVKNSEKQSKTNETQKL